MNELLEKYDRWLSEENGPAALTIRELLEPVEGPDGIFFPATYAAAEDKTKFAGGYNIDVFPDAPNICLVDSVGSEANRIEPLFAKSAYRNLIPQITIIAGSKRINLLNAGHRAGDALVRFTKAGEIIWNAFKSLQEHGNAEPMAKIAPTSLLFGVWDSRGTQVKIARAFRSVIRAYNVRKLSRSAQFNRATKYVEEGLIKEELDAGDGDKNPLSREGFKDSPATASHGGVVCLGQIQRETTINLSAIRRLHSVDNNIEQNGNSKYDLNVQRYILGLALVAATAVCDDLYDLREGCQFRRKPKCMPEWKEIPYRGEDILITDLDDKIALQYAQAAAEAFGVGESDEYIFDTTVAEQWLSLKKDEQDKRRRNGPMTMQFENANKKAKDSSETNTSSTSRRNRRQKSSEEK